MRQLPRRTPVTPEMCLTIDTAMGAIGCPGVHFSDPTHGTVLAVLTTPQLNALIHAGARIQATIEPDGSITMDPRVLVEALSGLDQDGVVQARPMAIGDYPEEDRVHVADLIASDIVDDMGIIQSDQ